MLNNGHQEQPSGDPEELIAALTAEIALHPASAEAYLQRGNACSNTRQYTQANRELQRHGAA